MQFTLDPPDKHCNSKAGSECDFTAYIVYNIFLQKKIEFFKMTYLESTIRV